MDSIVEARKKREEWLADLEVGDQVARAFSTASDEFFFGTVIQSTKTQVKVRFDYPNGRTATQKFRRKDGSEIGDYVTKYDPGIVEWTSELRAEVQERKTRRELLAKCPSSIYWRNYDNETIIAVLKLLGIIKHTL